METRLRKEENKELWRVKNRKRRENPNFVEAERIRNILNREKRKEELNDGRKSKDLCLRLQEENQVLREETLKLKVFLIYQKALKFSLGNTKKHRRFNLFFASNQSNYVSVSFRLGRRSSR